MTSPGTRTTLSRRALLTAAAAVALLAAASTLTVAGAFGAFSSSRSHRSAALYGANHGRNYAASCAAPTLPGTSIAVRLIDMRSMMTRNGMMGGSGMMGQGDWRYFHRGMMRVLTSTTSVPAGTVSLAVTNTGYQRRLD